MRRLAAILAADVVGYSRMMAADEAGTLGALKRHRERIFDPSVAANSGRVVKLIGDGTLAEFASVVDAVNCALAIQRAVAAEAPPGDGPRIVLRIGINLGDVIIDDDDIYGDGVNIAARLEPLADPGGVCVSHIVNESVGSRVDAAFVDGGEVSVKNIDRPIRVWKWHPDLSAAPKGAPAAAKSAPAAPTPPKQEKPSIAVLPFNNMSGDAEQEYFSDGISEDIITDLSKVGGLTVIARNSSFTYKGRSVDIRSVGRELGVRSVLEGSIRRAGNRVRITAQLINAEDGAHIWADRFDRDLNDIFAVQDEVTQQIVKALKVALTPQEKERLATDQPAALDGEALDAVLKARTLMIRPTKNRGVFTETVTLLERALELQPNYSEAKAALSMAYNLDYHNRWSANPDASLKRAVELADEAIAMNADDPFAHYAASVAAMFLRDLDKAERELEITLNLSPNYAHALNGRGIVLMSRGKPDEAIVEIEKALRLDPAFSQQYLHFLGVAHYALEHYETAATYFRARITLEPETDLSRGFLIATLGQLGQTEEAAKIHEELRALNPDYSFSGHIGRLAIERQSDVDRLLEGWAKAGVPDQRDT